MIKRLFDSVIAAVLGILCLPLALLIACAIWLESGSPIIYPSLRVGQFGNPFFYFRFRTMAGNPLRKTRFGRFIGNLSLDELPALWNILKGDLSIVGPRPEIPEKVDLSDPVWQTILSVRPGITGLGLLSYLDKYNETDVQERIQPDLFYALNHSFSLDIRLMWKTVYLWAKMGHLKGKMRSNEK
jgi:lipopolysaccharide/colanic/teichoic acid biosynthesis glycosyltransferase